MSESQSSSTATGTAPQRRILLVEDNVADASLTKIVHDEVKHCSWLDIVRSGAEAVEYLSTGEQGLERRGPDVILMDMFLPMESGLELISRIRAIEGCELIPIVMISGSNNPVTLRQAYQLGANCVIKKANQWDDYFKKLESCFHFWCSVVELPHAS